MDRVDRVETLTRRRALECGYWFARGLLDAPPLTALRGQVLEICARRGWLEGRRGFASDSPEFHRLQLEAQSLAAFDALRSDVRLRAALQELLGGAVRDRQGDVCRVLFPGAPEFATPAHRDQTYLKSSEPTNVDGVDSVGRLPAPAGQPGGATGVEPARSGDRGAARGTVAALRFRGGRRVVRPLIDLAPRAGELQH